MKKLLLTLLCIFTTLSGAYAQESYYWYKGQKKILHAGNKRYILFRSQRDSNLAQYQQSGATDDSSIKWGIQDASMPLPAEAVYYSPSFKVENNSQKDLYITDKFYVKLKKNEDYGLLEQFAQEHDVNIVKAASVPLWYVLTCTNQTNGHALQMANLFYESGLFAAAQPEFINAFEPTCCNDTYFADQWNLYNSGQYGASYSGIDINYCAAHAITTGNDSIIIAVFDQGVDLTHEDLNIYNVSYNTETGTSPSQVLGDHGTACAGIIGAIANNNKGIAGIAPGCPIMSISNSLTIPISAIKIADGFIFAANNNASVISNSWFATHDDEMINDAINYALINGRNGLGCVVVFSSGNQSNNVSYPANSNEDIIVVGAMSPCGERCSFTSCNGESWGSNFGPELDIMAPGTLIQTTDRMGTAGYSYGNYTYDFGGTSAACPHVAAVAGLILSVNPYLTQQEVAEIINSTAQKVGNYIYATSSAHANGTWCEQMGYGLVDASAAVQAAYNYHLVGNRRLCDEEVYRIVNIPSMMDVRWSYETDIVAAPHRPVIRISDTLSSVITIQRGSSCIPFYAPNPECYYNGNVTLKAKVTDNTGLHEYEKILLLHEDKNPTIPVFEREKITLNETRTFNVFRMSEVPDRKIKWKIALPGSTDTIVHYGHSWTITASIPAVDPGIMNIRLYNLENCDPSSFTSYNVRIDYHALVDPFDPFLSFPNPVTTGTVGIQVIDKNYSTRGNNDEEAAERQDIDYTLELWDNDSRLVRSMNSTIRGEKDVITLDVNGLRNSIYLLTLRVNDEILTTSKMIINR